MPKFLCLTAHDPDGPDHGAILRVRHLFRLLARFGDVRVALVGYHGLFDEQPEPPRREFEIATKINCHFTGKPPLLHRARRQLSSRFLNLEGVQTLPADRERARKLMAEHDLVWVHNLKVANAVGIWRWPHSVLDVDDVASEFAKTYITNAPGIFDKLRNLNQFILWRRQERKIAERFDALCVCSEFDRMKFPRPEKIFVLPNGFHPPETEPVRHPASPPQIGFVGTFHYPPNREGAEWFLNRVWPRLLGHFPNARLRLAGKGGNERDWHRPNVDALGFVPDLSAEMAGWSFAIVPIFAGAGTRIKIADAFSRKIPVVSTRLGAHGYDVRDGREIFIGNSPNEFLKRCLRILERPPVGEVLAENAWKKFREKWTWDLHAASVAEIVRTVLRGADFSDDADSPDLLLKAA